MSSLAQRLEHSRRYRSSTGTSNKSTQDNTGVNPASPTVELPIENAMHSSIQSRRQRALQLVSRRRASHAHSVLEPPLLIEGMKVQHEDVPFSDPAAPPVEAEETAPQSTTKVTTAASELHPSRISFEKPLPKVSSHKKTWTTNDLNTSGFPVPLTSPKSHMQAWRNTRASPRHSEMSPVAFVGNEKTVFGATIETPSTVSVASLRASFNARASSQPPMPMTSKDARVRYSVITKKSVKSASPAIVATSVHVEQRDPSPTFRVPKVSDSNANNLSTQSNCIASPEREQHSPSTRSHGSSQSQNSESNRRAEPISSVLSMQPEQECQGRYQSHIAPHSPKQSKVDFPPIQSERIVVENFDGGPGCYREENAGLQVSSFGPSDRCTGEPVRRLLVDDVQQSTDRDHHEPSSPDKSAAESPLAQTTIESSLVVDFDEAMMFAADSESFVDDDSISNGSNGVYVSTLPDTISADALQLSNPSDGELFVGQLISSPSRLAIKESDSTSVYIESDSKDNKGGTHESLDNPELCQSQMRPNKERNLVTDETSLEDHYLMEMFDDFVGSNSRAPKFDDDGWPIQHSPGHSSHHDWMRTPHPGTEMDAFCEGSIDPIDGSQGCMGNGPGTLKSASATLPMSFLAPEPSGGLPTFEQAQKNLKKPPPFDPFADEEEATGLQDPDSFFPPAEEFSPVNWHADSYHQTFEI